MKFNRCNGRTALIITLILLVVALLGYLGYQRLLLVPPPEPEGLEEPQPVPPVEEPSLPAEEPPIQEIPLHTPLYETGQFGPDEERRQYVDQSLLLEIPRLDYTGSVFDGMTEGIKSGDKATTAMDETVLNNGVVLFNQAQLPGPENRNVSIAGHRDIHGKEFYYADRIVPGDLLYLLYQGKRYTYETVDTLITDPRDWSRVATSEYSTLTLQTCDPINVASHRLFVTAHLIEITPLSPEEIATLQETFPAFSGTEDTTSPPESSQP